MAPIDFRCSCIVCGKFLKDTKAKPLGDQDSFWKQHAEEIRSASEDPLEEFSKYFGVSLSSATAFVKDEDVDQVLEELAVCSDCNDWLLYGAFLKEKYLKVDRVLRQRIRNAFISGRFESRFRSTTGTVVEQLRQCLLPCIVRVNKVAAPDLLSSTKPSESETSSYGMLPVAKRRRIIGSVQNSLFSDAAEPEDGGGGSGDEGDTAMNSDDHFDVNDALDIGGEGVDNLQGTDAVTETRSKRICSESRAQRNKPDLMCVTSKRRPGPKSKTRAFEIVPPESLYKKKEKPVKLIISKECPVCQVDVPDYLRHMNEFHYVQPHRFLLNNFWCKGCKIAYQPPDPQTPTGQYLPQHIDAFLRFIQIHSKRACRYSYNVAPHPCRFCDAVFRHKSRPALEVMNHEAKLHGVRFGEDYPWTVELEEWRRKEAQQKLYFHTQRKRFKMLHDSRTVYKSVPATRKTVASTLVQPERIETETKITDMDSQSPLVMLKNEEGVFGEEFLEDPLMMEVLMDNVNNGYNTQEVAETITLDSRNETPPEQDRNEEGTQHERDDADPDGSNSGNELGPFALADVTECLGLDVDH